MGDARIYDRNDIFDDELTDNSEEGKGETEKVERVEEVVGNKVEESLTTETTTLSMTETTKDPLEALFDLFAGNETNVKDDIGTKPDLEEIKNKTVLWIDASYKALDYGMNVTIIPECEVWQDYWENNSTLIEKVKADNESSSDELDLGLVEYELVEKKSRAKELGFDPLLFEEHSSIGVLFKEICGNHDRQYWYKNTEDARKLGMDETSPICDPFKEELNPNAETLAQLAALLNELIHNKTRPGAITDNLNMTEIEEETSTLKAGELLQEVKHAEEVTEIPQRVVLRLKRKTEASTEDEAAKEGEDDWLEDIAFESKEILSINKKLLEKLEEENSTIPMDAAWIQIDATDEASPLMYIHSEEAAKYLNLNIPSHHFNRYEKVVLYLPGVCSDYVPTAIDAFNASDFEGIEIEGPIGVNISALEAAGVNLTELAEKLRNDTEVDDILSRTNGSMRTLGGSYILPVLHKNQYDPFSAPIVFQGSAVAVRFGIYIESMSNFQTSTMDYDMDISLLMAWRDARLFNPYDKPILVKEEEILEKIWRPDPFFANAKESEFHEVTFLNFLMRIFNDGLVLYETRVKLKPACNLILCKYPHDKQTCELQIKSFAYPIETVRFEWFTKKNDAIDKNPDVKLPELYIDRYEPTICNRTRKSGDFSCLRAVFRLKRDVGFHIAQTYIPTSLALMFSWVGVWLPEEFMEGRIGVAITVLLTLSTESAGAREHLPSVSYLKAIDLWFGYVTGFVFFTLLQTLFVIGFDKRANQLKKWATRKRLDVTQEARDTMLNKANRYHKTGRYLDNFCRVFYPLSFVLFLIMYYFVFTEGRQDSCLSRD
ncbi:hypothetical protein FO519_006265 [Halicephalobus sp. NKZ332]|nr:hypothetical protein FO519_006265 [Halicephalobus sp. NKZ332]